jgi:hypothetical protein
MKTTVQVLYYPVIVRDSEAISDTYSTSIQVICLDENATDYEWIIEGISEAPSDQLAIWTSSQQEFDNLILGDDIADGFIIESINRENPMKFEIVVQIFEGGGNFLAERRVH